jgi:phage FluMu protein Com
VVAAPSTILADGATPAAVPPRPATAHKVDAWLQEHAAGHRMRFTEVVGKHGGRAWNIDCDACGKTLSKVGSIGVVMRHVKRAKHVNALSADENPDTRVVQHQKKNKLDDWLQQHAAEHKMRFTEVVGNPERRAWTVDCDACGMTMPNVQGMRHLMQHMKSAKHVNARSADESPDTRVLQYAKKNKLDDWLRQHATEHRMRFTEIADNPGRRAWNIDCDACGKQLSKVGSTRELVRHVQVVTHVNALSAHEHPDIRVVRYRKSNSVDDWLRQHVAEHKMRFTEVVNKHGGRAWNIDCDACGMTLSKVGTIVDLMKHVKSARHVNALSVDEDPETRVVQRRTTNAVDAWLRVHAGAHRMRFTEVVGKRGQRLWNVVCGTCCAALHRISAVPALEGHLKTALHLGAKVSSAPTTRERKRTRS